MWQLYVDYGRGSAVWAVVGVFGTLFGRAAGLLPPLVLGLAIDAVLLGAGPYRLPFIPADWIPATAAGRLWLSVGVIAASFVVGAGLTWVQNRGWNAFAQDVQHALRVDAYEAM